jgi:hypothetical protein
MYATRRKEFEISSKATKKSATLSELNAASTEFMRRHKIGKSKTKRRRGVECRHREGGDQHQKQRRNTIATTKNYPKIGGPWATDYADETASGSTLATTLAGRARW